MASPAPEQVDPTQVANGRRYLLVAFGFMALTSVAVTATYLVRLGPGQLPQQVIRLGLLLLLGYFVLQGRAWARWLLLALLIGAIWVAIPAFARQGAFSRENVSGTLPLLAMYLGYGVVARGLLWSESVRAFFRAHKLARQRRAGGGDDIISPAA